MAAKLRAPRSMRETKSDRPIKQQKVGEAVSGLFSPENLDIAAYSLLAFGMLMVGASFIWAVETVAIIGFVALSLAVSIGAVSKVRQILVSPAQRYATA